LVPESKNSLSHVAEIGPREYCQLQAGVLGLQRFYTAQIL
jgi:hypothetical protein